MPAAPVFTVGAGAASLFDTSKLVSGGTSTPTPALTPAVSTPRGAVILLVSLTVLCSEIFHHCLQLLCLWFFLPEEVTGRLFLISFTTFPRYKKKYGIYSEPNVFT